MADKSARLRRDAAAWLARLRAPDGERDRAAFEAWRGADPDHAAAFERVAAHWRTSARLASSPLAHTVELRSQPVLRHTIGYGALAVGGVAAIMVFALRVPDAASPLSGPQVASALGQIRRVALADGSYVVLDTDSVISLHFTDRERRVRLDRGRARFTVAPDPRRRFVVAVGNLEIYDKGTVFDVNMRGTVVDVTLIEGGVEVHGRTPRALAKSVKLAPGQRVRIVADATPVVDIGNSAGAAWTTGVLSYEATPLEEVVRDANRYSATKLVLAPRLEGLRITGAFHSGAPAELATSLAAAFSLRAETRPDGSILLFPGNEPPDAQPPASPERKGG